MSRLNAEKSVLRYCVLAASVIVLLAGSLSAFGRLTGSYTLIGIGAATAMSPMPLPFDDSRGLQENFAIDFRFHFSMADGREIEVVGDKIGVPGPHKRKIPFIIALVFSPWTDEQIVMDVLEYGFCSEQRPVTLSFGIDGVIEQVRVLMQSKTPGMEESWDTSISCNH